LFTVPVKSYIGNVSPVAGVAPKAVKPFIVRPTSGVAVAPSVTTIPS